MKKSLELKEARSGLVETLEGIKSQADGDNRNLNEAESTEVDVTLAQIDKLDIDIKRSERVEAELRTAAAVSGEKISTNKSEDLRDYSFQKAMKAAVTGKLTGIVKEMDEEARNENPSQLFRGVGIPVSVLQYRGESRAAITTAASSPLEVMSFSDQLEANLTLASAGANYYSGVADMKFPLISSISSSWVAEDSGSDVAAAGSTSSLTLQPKKLISVVDMSAEAMTQNPGLEAALRRNMAQNIASTWELALLSNADVTSAPLSIFADANGAYSGAGAITAAQLIALETNVLANNVQTNGARFAYLCSPEALADIKTLAMVSSVSPIWDNNDKTINSIYQFVSQNVGDGSASGKDVLFGDFSRVHLAQFGGIDLLFDPYTKSRQGVGSLIAVSLVDGDAVNNATAFQRIENAT